MYAIQLRSATQADVGQIYEWRNAPETRQFSFNDTPLAWDAHVRWFENFLQRSDCFLLIAEIEQQAVGVLKYHIIESEAKVDIYLVPGFYGKGIGTQLLTTGIEWVKKNLSVKNIKAEIFTENIASLRAFTKAGFKEQYRVYHYSLDTTDTEKSYP